MAINVLSSNQPPQYTVTTGITASSAVTWAAPHISSGSSVLTVGSDGTVDQSALKVNGTVSADDLMLDGVSLKDVIRSIQDRLAILVPDPKKLEKYEALKAAYSHYKMLEALIGKDDE